MERTCRGACRASCVGDRTIDWKPLPPGAAPRRHRTYAPHPTHLITRTSHPTPGGFPHAPACPLQAPSDDISHYTYTPMPARACMVYIDIRGYWSYALCTSRACLADFAHSMQSPPPHVPIPHPPAASATRHAHPQSAQAPPCLRKPPWQVRTQTATAALARRPARTAPTTRSPRRWGRSLGRPR